MLIPSTQLPNIKAMFRGYFLLKLKKSTQTLADTQKSAYLCTRKQQKGSIR